MILVWIDRCISLFRTVFLLLCLAIEECECENPPEEYAMDIMNRTDRYRRPIDFRCLELTLTAEFDFSEHFLSVGYPLEDYKTIDKKHRCTNYAEPYYPVLKGLDPMMPYYINTLHRGMVLAHNTTVFLSEENPLIRRKFYCASMRLVVNAFLDYWESFHSDNNLCRKMAECIKNCQIFRQIREMFTTKLLEKLCLDEDGCCNVMKYYEDDLPYCVKYTAISEFKNSSFGSWHHTTINYCKLTEMVPEAKAEKYDRSLLTQKGRTKENLGEMCLYLRYRLLPEEGKEQEIPDDAAEYDTETTTGTEYKNGVSILFTALYWIILYLTLVNV